MQGSQRAKSVQNWQFRDARRGELADGRRHRFGREDFYQNDGKDSTAIAGKVERA